MLRLVLLPDWPQLGACSHEQVTAEPNDSKQHAATHDRAAKLILSAHSCSGTHWQRYGPLYLMLLAVPLVMADLTRHVLQGER